MNKSLAFFGRQGLIENLWVFYAQRKHVLIIGVEGIGKTALLRQVREQETHTKVTEVTEVTEELSKLSNGPGPRDLCDLCVNLLVFSLVDSMSA